MKTREVVKYILSEYKKFDEWNKKLEVLGVQIGHNNSDPIHMHDIFTNIILKIYSVPEDSTTKIGLDSNTSFCRDIFTDVLYKFTDNEIQEDDFFYFFENWKAVVREKQLFEDFMKKIGETNFSFK